MVNKSTEFNHEKMSMHINYQIIPGSLGNMDPNASLFITQLELKLGIGGTSYEDFIRSMHLPMQLRYSSYLGLLSLNFSSFVSLKFDFHLRHYGTFELFLSCPL